MNNINDKLISRIFEISADYYNHNLMSDDLRNFLRKRRFTPRQQEAIKIIEDILTTHGKEKLLSQLSKLANIEIKIRELQPWQRDHVVHALLSYILGIYLNEYFLRSLGGGLVPSLQWKLAGLLHDVAYPIQIGRNIVNYFADGINEIKGDLDVDAPDIVFQVVQTNIDRLRCVSSDGFGLVG
jgi:hypothetical protein